ncbi:hypothetical protein [Streptomyces sp. NPDC029004]|uniref:hypothetical protein n=1 Tax=Streptomyces sp. NPDC029004 TaxID=3154490 RepID=UPI0033FB0445
MGLAAGFAVAALSNWMHWGPANALITAVSTVVATELYTTLQVRPVIGLVPPAVWIISGPVGDLVFAGQVSVMGPAQEVPYLPASWMLGQPPVDVGLGEVGKR